MGRAEADILELLWQTGGAYQSEVVKATGFSKSTVSEALAQLEAKRLVRKVAVGKSLKLYPIGREVRKQSLGHEQGRGGRGLRLGFTRAAEYPFLVPFRRALGDSGIELDFEVYENGVEVARDLSELRIDLGVAPVLTLFMYYSLDAPFKVLAPAGSGGASMFQGAKSHSSLDRVAAVTCTRVSTMELMMRSAMRDSIIPDTSRIVYAAGPAQMQQMLATGLADVGCIWEPYATILESQGARRIVRYTDLADHVCCALAASNRLSEKTLTMVSRRYEDSMNSFRRDPDAHLSAYAALSGLEASLLRRVSKEYSYPEDFGSRVVERQLERAGLVLPSIASFRGALARS